MDLREIIKWFIPCFHILLKLDPRITLIWLLLFCNLCPGMTSASELEESNSNLNSTKNIVMYANSSKLNQSEVYNDSKSLAEDMTTADFSVGRTFGRPMKKMMQALIPLAMAIGSAGTWAVVAALIGAKTLVVTLFILKLLLMAGAAKAVELLETGFRNRQAFYSGHQNTQAHFGYPAALFDPYQRPRPHVQPKLVMPIPTAFGGLVAGKVHHPQPHYAPAPAPSKEIHLHIHNGGHHESHHEEEIIPNLSSWSRDSPATAASAPSISKTSAEAYNPYLYLVGPQTIRTPYGNYVKVD